MTRYPDTKKIRSKLRTGTSIDDVCREYNLTFPELLWFMQRLGPENKNVKKGYSYTRTGHKYINRNSSNGKFIIRKNHKHFGTFRSLDDAIKVRDWFICNRWDKRWLDRACSECDVERCKPVTLNKR